LTFTAGRRAPRGTRVDYTCDGTVGEIAAIACRILRQANAIARDNALIMDSRDAGTKGDAAST